MWLLRIGRSQREACRNPDCPVPPELVLEYLQALQKIGIVE